MGISASKTCFPKKKRKNLKFDKINEALPADPAPSLDKKFTSQYLLNDRLSSSEINLLNQLREGKENFKRPKGVECPRFIRNKPIIRLASWNLHNLTAEKLKNPGVLTVICLTILENSFSIIALQEINDKTVAKMICDELNKPTLTKIKLQTNSRNWNCVVSDQSLGKTFQGNEYGVIIYDKSRKVEVLQNSQLSNNLKSFTRDPFFVNLKINSESYLLVVLHIKAVNVFNKSNSQAKVINEINDLAILTAALKDILKPGRKVVLLGDFNESANSECFDCIRKENYMFCIDSSVSTSTSKTVEKSYDNIWINKACEVYFTGNSGVIKEGLSHPHIPKAGMRGWGGCVSDHCPIWADLFIRV